MNRSRPAEEIFVEIIHNPDGTVVCAVEDGGPPFTITTLARNDAWCCAVAAVRGRLSAKRLRRLVERIERSAGW